MDWIPFVVKTLVTLLEIVVTIVVTDWVNCVDAEAPVICWLTVDVPAGCTLNVSEAPTTFPAASVTTSDAVYVPVEGYWNVGLWLVADAPP